MTHSVYSFGSSFFLPRELWIPIYSRGVITIIWTNSSCAVESLKINFSIYYIRLSLSLSLIIAYTLFTGKHCMLTKSELASRSPILYYLFLLCVQERNLSICVYAHSPLFWRVFSINLQTGVTQINNHRNVTRRTTRTVFVCCASCIQSDLIQNFMFSFGYYPSIIKLNRFFIQH